MDRDASLEEGIQDVGAEHHQIDDLEVMSGSKVVELVEQGILDSPGGEAIGEQGGERVGGGKAGGGDSDVGQAGGIGERRDNEAELVVSGGDILLGPIGVVQGVRPGGPAGHGEGQGEGEDQGTKYFTPKSRPMNKKEATKIFTQKSSCRTAERRDRGQAGARALLRPLGRDA